MGRAFAMGSTALRGPAQPQRAGHPASSGTGAAHRGEALRDLLHDATEALIGGFDPITPLKPHLGEGYIEINRRLQAAVNRRYDLPPWTVASRRLHKDADRLAAASEALHVVGWRQPALRRELGITLTPLKEDPLPTPPGMLPWEPWPAPLAAECFETALRDLIRQRAGVHAGKQTATWPMEA